MANFTFKAVAADGTLSTGEVTAADRGEALRTLGKRGLQPVSVKQEEAASTALKEKPKAAPKKPSRKKPAARPTAVQPAKGKSSDPPEPASGPIKLKRNDVVFFTEELSEMLSAGLQLEPALRTMENREELGNLKNVAVNLRQLVRDGSSFSVALNKVSPSFGPLYCSMAAAGEASGALPSILEAQANYLKTLQDLQTRVTLALIYPAFLVLAGIGVAVIFITKLIPQLISLLGANGGPLPLGIRLLVGANDFIQKYGLIVVASTIIISMVFKAWKDKPENRPVWDENKIKIPGYGRVVESRFHVQFLETLANLISNGLPLMRALELTRDATVNLFYKRNLDGVIDEVGDGRSFSRAMIRSGMFPPVMIDMIAVGEQTGKLDLALRRAAVRFDKELNNALQKLMALIMSIVLIAMAVLIGGMMYMMVNAIFQTIENVG